jgi:pilus assembly protein CpaE
VDQRSIRAFVSVAGVDLLEVEQSLPQDPNFQLIGIAEDLESTVHGVQSSTVDLLLVACTGEIDRALQVIDHVHAAEPALPILVLAKASPNGFLRRAFEFGASDVITLPLSNEQLRFAMTKALARGTQASAESRGEKASSLICVLGPKGGTGKTLTSCNLAVALAEMGQSVLIIDLDLQFGDVALCLGSPPESTIYDLALSGGSLDLDKLQAYVTAHPSGVHALLAPNRPDQASVITIDLLRDIYAIARMHYDTIVVDTPPGFTAEVIATIDSSSDLVMVGMLDSLSLKNTKLGLETLELMDYDPDKIKLLLNRAHSRVGISQSDVVAVLGQMPDVFVPSDREIPRAVNEGVPIVTARPQSESAEAFRSLAHLFTGTAPVAVAENGHITTVSRRKLFGRKA